MDKSETPCLCEIEDSGSSLIKKYVKTENLCKSAQTKEHTKKNSLRDRCSTVIKKWLNFSGRRKTSLIRPYINQIVKFLRSIFDSGVCYKAVYMGCTVLNTVVTIPGSPDI